MKSGLLLTLKLLVPYDPNNLDSITAAAAAAKKLCSPDELGAFAPPGVEIVSAKSEPYRSRDPKVKAIPMTATEVASRAAGHPQKN